MSVKAREEVRKLPENEDRPVLILELDNGDRKIFESVKKDWNFKDEESLVRFAIAILSKSSDKKTIAYPDDSGELQVAKPQDSLLNK